jgi:hypothetical protein
MITSSEAERDALAEAVVVANTPASLLNWLQQNSTVQRLAEESQDNLLDELHRIIRANRRTDVDLGWAYGLLVAIGVRRRTRSEVFGSLPIDGALLKWASTIWDKLRKSAIPTQKVTLVGKIDQPVMTIHHDGGAKPTVLDQHGRPAVMKQVEQQLCDQ